LKNVKFSKTQIGFKKIKNSFVKEKNKFLLLRKQKNFFIFETDLRF